MGMKTTTRHPSLTRTATHTVELCIHRPWGMSKSYFRSSVEAYETAEELTKAGYTVSIAVR